MQIRPRYLSAILLTLLSVTLIHGHPYIPAEPSDAAQRLLYSNAEWAENVTKADPSFFTRSAQGQDPKVLWIGCSDSRVPESVITHSAPGDIFVQRNIANQAEPKDTNTMSALEYAVEDLEVEHVIVVGHSKCGGATASFLAAQNGSDPSQTLHDVPVSSPLNQWLEPLTRFALSLKPQFSSKSEDQALQFFIEENVKKQVNSIAHTKVMEETWKKELEGKGRKVRVYGWIHDLSTGRLRDLNITRGASEH